MGDFENVFKKRKKMQILVTIVAALAVMVSYFTNLQTIVLVIVIGLVVFTRFNWRCPKCNKYLGRSGNPTHCSNCGEKLQ